MNTDSRKEKNIKRLALCTAIAGLTVGLTACTPQETTDEPEWQDPPPPVQPEQQQTPTDPAPQQDAEPIQPEQPQPAPFDATE